MNPLALPAGTGDDDPLFSDEDSLSFDLRGPGNARAGWTVLVVDDDSAVHEITQIALRNLELDGQPLRLVSAYSAEEALALAASHPDAAVALIDVVMERDDAGFALIRAIRSQLGNQLVRLLVRTGQPGLAPPGRVLLDYDINDYLAKTDMTADRLRTAVIGALRSFRDLRTIERHREALARVLAATSDLHELRPAGAFIERLLALLAELAPPSNAGLVAAASARGGAPVVLAATARFERSVGEPVHAMLPAAVAEQVVRAASHGAPQVIDGYLVVGISSATGEHAVVVLAGVRGLEAHEQQTLELFCGSAALAFDRVRAYEDQRDLLRAASRFLPDRLLRLLGRDDLRTVEAGDHAYLDVTIMFCDVRSFSALAERLPPLETFSLVTEVLREIAPVVEQHGGVVDKYLGDGLMAIFPEEPTAAVRAALQAHAALAARPTGRIHLSVGIHRGPVVLGTVGYERRLDTTVISDTVNVAARIERMTRDFGVPILISGAVAHSVDDPERERLRRLGRVHVRGRQERLDIVEVLVDRPHVADPDFDDAVDALEAGRPADAARLLERVLARHPDDAPAAVLLGRCKR